MNRLHHIRQTALAYLIFPGSVTTRFSHVVGALHTGGKMICQILSTLSDNDFARLFPTLPSRQFIIQSIRLACLFHDVGHGPFSHSAEYSMLKVTQQYYKEDIPQAKKLFNEENENKIPIHEFFSYKLITAGEIANTIHSHEDVKEGKLLVDIVSQLLIKSDEEGLVQENPGFGILRKLVSSQLDADRMDYLLRDGMMSGVKFGLVDVDRVIKNMAIVQVDNDYELAFHERSIGAIEDMLDARFKMYRWFYSHHTVVMTNELIRLAIEKLVEEDEAIAKLFHWSAFEDGLSTDENILLQLRKRVNLSEYHSFRGILDRRYLPVSLFKSTPDFGRFMADIVNRAKRKESLHVVREKIINFFNKEEAGATLKSRLESTGGELSNCVILNTDVVMKPYEPFSESEKVYLYRTGESQLCELSSESEYFRAVNEAWKHYHGLYVFYLIPGQKKEKFAQYKNIVIDIFAEEIAKTY